MQTLFSSVQLFIYRIKKTISAPYEGWLKMIPDGLIIGSPIKIQQLSAISSVQCWNSAIVKDFKWSGAEIVQLSIISAPYEGWLELVGDGLLTGPPMRGEQL